MTLQERFEAKYIPEPNSGCWLWIGSSLPQRGALPTSQYGQMWSSKLRHHELAHRISYKLHRGKIPQGMSVLHRCDQPCCVNPDHLFLGTRTDNMRDKMSKGRDRRAPPRGIKHPCAKLTDDMVREIRRLPGSLQQLARRFGVHSMSIFYIKRRKTWRDVV